MSQTFLPYLYVFWKSICLMCFVVTVWTYFFSISCGIQGDQWAEISWSRKDGSVDRKVSHLKRSQIFHQNLQSNHKPNVWRASRVSHGGKATARMHRTLAINVPPYREKETTWNNRFELELLLVELEWRHLTHLTISTIYDWIRSHFVLTDLNHVFNHEVGKSKYRKTFQALKGHEKPETSPEPGAVVL